MVVEELPAKVDVVDELAATKDPNPPIRKLRRLDVQIWDPRGRLIPFRRLAGCVGDHPVTVVYRLDSA
jgi:hypothetical protein